MTYVCELWNLKRPRSGPEYGFSVRDGVVHFDYDDGSLFVDAANEMQYVVTCGDLRFNDVHDLLRIWMARLHLWECDLYKVCPVYNKLHHLRGQSLRVFLFHTVFQRVFKMDYNWVKISLRFHYLGTS